MNALLENLDRLHTTPGGVTRIKRNLSLDTEDVVQWCARQIRDERTAIRRAGKNWYAKTETCEITVNAHSYTIITAHAVAKSV